MVGMHMEKPTQFRRIGRSSPEAAMRQRRQWAEPTMVVHMCLTPLGKKRLVETNVLEIVSDKEEQRFYFYGNLERQCVDADTKLVLYELKTVPAHSP